VSEPELPGLPSLGLGPALTVKTSLPRIDLPTFPSPAEAHIKLPARKIRLRAEWGLVLFTVAIPALVAWFWAGLLRPESAPAAILVLLAGGLAMGTSTLHLGKPLRAWRAMLNLRSSPLSREILLTSAFLATATAARLVSAESALAVPLSGVALVAGMSAVLSIDAVYRRISRLGTRFHSAEAWLTVVFLAGLIGQVLPLWLPAAVLKASFALLPNKGVPAQERSGFSLLATRIALLLAAFALALIWDSPWSTPASVATALAGEILDRCRFYLELEPVSPARLLAMASASVQGTSSATPSFKAFSLNPVTSFAKNESTSTR
jgi:DMSO reductase anchor subunit